MNEHPLRQYRDANKLTQEGLADLLEVTPMAVSRWERGLYTPNRTMRRRITEKTGIKPETLLARESDAPAPQPAEAAE